MDEVGQTWLPRAHRNTPVTTEVLIVQGPRQGGLRYRTPGARALTESAGFQGTRALTYVTSRVWWHTSQAKVGFRVILYLSLSHTSLHGWWPGQRRAGRVADTPLCFGGNQKMKKIYLVLIMSNNENPNLELWK